MARKNASDEAAARNEAQVENVVPLPQRKKLADKKKGMSVVPGMSDMEYAVNETADFITERFNRLGADGIDRVKFIFDVCSKIGIEWEGSANRGVSQLKDFKPAYMWKDRNDKILAGIFKDPAHFLREVYAGLRDNPALTRAKLKEYDSDLYFALAQHIKKYGKPPGFPLLTRSEVVDRRLSIWGDDMLKDAGKLSHTKRMRDTGKKPPKP